MHLDNPNRGVIDVVVTLVSPRFQWIGGSSTWYWCRLLSFIIINLYCLTFLLWLSELSSRSLFHFTVSIYYSDVWAQRSRTLHIIFRILVNDNFALEIIVSAGSGSIKYLKDRYCFAQLREMFIYNMQYLVRCVVE